MPGVWAGMSGAGPSPTLTFATSAPFDRRCAARRARPALPLEAVEEPSDLLPHLAASGQPLPARTDHRHEPVALVDGDDEMPAGAAGAVDKKGLDIGLHLAQHRIGSLERIPRLESEQRLGRSQGTRIEGADPSYVRAVEEVGHLDRDAKLLPGDVVELEPFQAIGTVGDQLVVPAARRTVIEEHAARAARAAHILRLEVEHVAVVGGQRRPAELAALGNLLALRRLAAGEACEPRRAHAGAPRATRTGPPAFWSSGTGSSCTPSSSAARPGRRTS